MRGVKTGSRSATCGGALRSGKELPQTAQAFIDARDGGGVRDAHVPGCAKRFAGNDGDVLFFEKFFGDLRGSARIVFAGDLGENVEGAFGLGAFDAGNGTKAGEDMGSAPRVLTQHGGH